jgi:hypothetical protein
MLLAGEQGDRVELDEAGAEITMRVWFECESGPSWKKAETAGARDLAASLALNRSEVRRAAAELRSQLQTFPTRVPLQE